MNSLEKTIKANKLKIKSVVAEIGIKATENNLNDFVEKINPLLTPSSGGDPFKDAFNNSWDKGWGNYGKS